LQREKVEDKGIEVEPKDVEAADVEEAAKKQLRA
jgi:hypothetical protein